MEIATVGDWARRRAAEAPDAPALISADGGVLTYGALAATLDGAARDLAATGLRRGSTAALLCDSRAAGVVAAFAISEVATVAPLNPAAPEAELRDTLRRIEVDALAFPAGMSSAVALAEAEGLATLPFETPPDAPPGLVSFGAAADAPQPPRPDPDDLAFIVLTSGSTGRPKATAMPHRAMLARPTGYLAVQGADPDDVGAVFAPLYVSAGWNYHSAALASGSAMIVRDRFDAEAVLDDIEAGRLSWLAGGPIFQRALLDAALRRNRGVRAPRLRFLRATSQPLDPDLQARLEQVFGVPCLPAYACTEAGAIASARLPGEGPRRPARSACPSPARSRSAMRAELRFRGERPARSRCGARRSSPDMSGSRSAPPRRCATAGIIPATSASSTRKAR